MKSMTGYGSSRLTSPHLELDVQVKSVNGRFAEIRLHVPKEYFFIEVELRKLVAERVRRGTLDVYINRRLADKMVKRQLRVRTEVAKQWVKGYRQLGKQLRLEGDLHLSSLLQIPEVVQVEENFALLPNEKNLLFKQLKRALDNHDKERQREGKALKKELLSLLASLETTVRQMQVMKEKSRKNLKNRYEGRLQSIGLEGSMDPQRIAQEVVIHLDRADIAEEILRLSEHVQSCRQMISNGNAEGKKLDFYCQELLREVNTIGSKSQMAELTRTVVDAKSLVERFREQVQNVE